MMKCPSAHAYAKGNLFGDCAGDFRREQPIAVEHHLIIGHLEENAFYFPNSRFNMGVLEFTLK
jgi:hypothetical protein